MAGQKGFTFRPYGREKIELFRAGRLNPSLELLYWHPIALKRHRTAPLLKEREEFLLHLLRQGTSRTAVQRAEGVLIRAINALQLRRMRNLGMPEISKRDQRPGHPPGHAILHVRPAYSPYRI